MQHFVCLFGGGERSPIQQYLLVSRFGLELEGGVSSPIQQYLSVSMFGMKLEGVLALP